MKSLIALCTIATSLFLVQSCGETEKRDYSKEVDEGTFSGSTYRSEVLGWEMSFPDNWIITSKSSLESLDERSKNLTGDTLADMSGIKRLLAFQKNFENNFQSTMEDFSGKSKESYYTIIHDIHETIFNNYLDQRSGIDTTSSVITIDNQKFDAFEIELFTRKGENFANQLLLTSVVKDHFMSVTIVYNNKADRDKMLGLFKKSTFK